MVHLYLEDFIAECGTLSEEAQPQGAVWADGGHGLQLPGERGASTAPWG